MSIKNKYLSAAFKAVLSLTALCGILIQVGVFNGTFNYLAFRYYTLLSNVLCCLYFGVAAVATLLGRGRFLPHIKGALIMGITVTGLVYHFLLSGGTFSMGGAMALSNILLHYAVPLLSVLDWLLFDEKGHYTWRSPLSWVILPDVYFMLATAYGFLIGTEFYGGSRFPYFFIDYDKLGVFGVLLYVLVLNVLFAALGYIYYLLDRLMARKIKKTKHD